MLAGWFLCWQLALHILDYQGKNWGNKSPRHQLSSLIYSKGNSFRVSLGLGWNLTVSRRLGRVPTSKEASNKFLLSKCLVLKPVYLLCMWLPALGLVYILRAVCWHRHLPTWTENQYLDGVGGTDFNDQHGTGRGCLTCPEEGVFLTLALQLWAVVRT